MSVVHKSERTIGISREDSRERAGKSSGCIPRVSREIPKDHTVSNPPGR